MPSKSGTSGKKLFLFDGTAIIYRSYFAFERNPLINSDGENTSTAFGFVNTVQKIIRDEKPDYLAIVLDSKEPTFRHKIYDDYKATRAKMPNDLAAQLPRVNDVIEALRLPKYILGGFEADDIIGTLARWGDRQGLQVFLVSNDKDMYQLVGDNIRMYTMPHRSKSFITMGREEVKNKIGVYPEKIIEYMALTGDSSDNIPGIPGVGPKTALALLEQFGDFDSILDGAENIKAKGVRAKVLDNKEKAHLSKKLVTIDCQVPIDLRLDDLLRREPDREKCKSLFTRLEFFNILKEILGESTVVVKETPKKAANYIRVESIEQLKALVKKLSSKKEIAFDTETDSLDSLTANLVGISLSAKAGEGYYIPIGHTEKHDLNLPAKDVFDILSPLMENKSVHKIAQNFKYDLQVLERAGYTISPISFDTMLASYVLNPSGRGHNLDNLAMEHFSYEMTPIKDLIGSGKSQKSFATVDPQTASSYAAEDADYTFRLRGVFAPLLEDNNLAHLYYDIEMPLIRVLSQMEQAGVNIDTGFLNKLSHKMQTEMKQVSGAIYELAGGEFNINSTQQLSKILFEDLKLPPKGKTAKKTGYSTDVRVLEELSKIHDLPKAILEYRQLSKLKSTYVDALPALVKAETGRVHTTFNQAIAATGRLSSTDPNLQNIPVRTQAGREIRKAFIPRAEGYSLLVADYSQIELRILAHYSGDKGLIDAFKSGEDIHTRTAAEVYGVAPEDVTGEQRRAAKTANFAIIYGVSAFGLARQTELNLGESKEFIDTYFDRYPGIRKYMSETIEATRRDGYVVTLTGRRRYIPEINSKNYQRRQFAERTAINTPIQGTAADMIKIAMIQIDKAWNFEKSKMVLQVHDELVFDAWDGELDKLQELVRQTMTGAMKLKVPIAVDMGIGPNWLEAK